ncbi:hypothetical protein like AT3G09110 [Hibiscus trionum]|uniref:DUF674 domain-containing protein n=1 Tax=Hibiscus trionum TaxID=183268 RepID=A0A9W7HNH9_HIBTR|nr:hypothetical protein like AT3G09110 [Hibiscus trionum]
MFILSFPILSLYKDEHSLIFPQFHSNTIHGSRRRRRVLYAEAGKGFVDFLFNILTLPFATVIRLLTKEGITGCVGNLYESVDNLGDAYIQPMTTKDTLLKPACSKSMATTLLKPACSSRMATGVPLLLPNIKSSTPQKFYRCSFSCAEGYDYCADCRLYFTNDPTATCPSCSRLMNCTAAFVNPPNKVSAASPAADEGGYVKGVVKYTILDDLTVTPMSTISSITMLSKFDIKQVDALEEKVVNVGMNEAVELLKESLQSKTVLTDVFLSPKAGRKRAK